MKGKYGVYNINPSVVEVIHFLMDESPNVLLDFGVLMDLVAYQKFQGPRAGTVDVPMTYLAKLSHINYQKVAGSLARLEAWGFIERVRNSTRTRGATYRLTLDEGLALWGGVIQEEEEEEEMPLPDSQKALKDTQDMPELPVCIYDYPKRRAEIDMRPAAEARAFPVCPECGIRYPTAMGFPQQHLCPGCQLRHAYESGAKTLQVFNKIVEIDENSFPFDLPNKSDGSQFQKNSETGVPNVSENVFEKH